MEQTKKKPIPNILKEKYKSTDFPAGSPISLSLPPYSAFPFLPFSSVQHPGVGYADTQVSVCSTPGCQHLQHPGVVTQKTALLSTGIANRAYRKQRIYSLCPTKSLQESSVLYRNGQMETYYPRES